MYFTKSFARDAMKHDGKYCHGLRDVSQISANQDDSQLEWQKIYQQHKHLKAGT